ncbi:hypothetical protein [Plebeiibacterium sediminum]|uniref:Uncharacterized protein n=1 Tax=Plebeiibacterium sediminum TaxID=2992112 RepID=A0AAE3M8R3_9BACT|nr:hypothetical protein [Plebeiobacterium sediminum]MCW3789012.1 hypothetical protein [Plebeiobacterium sediminum]
MTEIKQEADINNSYKLYSQRAIGIATYIGGPIAAGWLIRENFRNLGNDDYGKHALAISILATFFIFAGIFSIPESVMDKIPNFIITLVYTGIIYLTVEKLQGKDIAAHQKSEGAFFSGWKAAGVGLINMVIYMVVILGYTFATPEASFDLEKYNDGIVQFQNNEKEAMELFNLLEAEKKEEAITFIKEKGINLWGKNILLLQKMNGIEGLDQELIDQNNQFIKYCQLRIKSYKLIYKALNEDTDRYHSELANIQRDITDILGIDQ